jgi:hypothetical protein
LHGGAFAFGAPLHIFRVLHVWGFMMRLSLTIAVAFAAVLQSAAAGDLACPATLDSDETAGGLSYKFRYVSFFDGDPREMADLAPEEGPNPKVLEQRWQFTRAPGRPIVMVCRYHGTDRTVVQEVPSDVQECRLEGLITGEGEIVGSPTLTCR